MSVNCGIDGKFTCTMGLQTMKKEKGLMAVGKHTKMPQNGTKVEEEEMINVALQLEKD